MAELYLLDIKKGKWRKAFLGKLKKILGITHMLTHNFKRGSIPPKTCLFRALPIL